MKKLLLFSFILCVFSVQAQVVEVSGMQEGVWNSDTVFVVGDVGVPVNSQLTVAAGTKVIFKGYHSINVKGGFEAIGNENDTIYFTAADTTGFHLLDSGRGGWNAITFEKCSGAVDLEYCHFSYGKAAEDVLTGGAIRAYYTNDIKISHCTFANNFTALRGAAMYAEHCDLDISDCEVCGSYGNSPIPGTYMHGGGFFFLNCTVNLEDLYVHDNICPNCYGGGMSFDSCDVVLNRAVFLDNQATNAAGLGIQRSGHRSVKMSNVLLYHNRATHYGGAMAISASSPEINNFTMANNITVIAGGGGFQVYKESKPVFTNCIIWGNRWGLDDYPSEIGSQIWIWNEESHPSFYYCTIQGGRELINNYNYIDQYENVLDLDPMFVDTAASDYRLASGSPCIDAGTPEIASLFIPETDLMGNERIFNERIDMGALEFNNLSVESLDVNKNMVVVSNNPLNVNTICRFTLDKNSQVSAKVYSIQGSLIWENDFGTLQAGANSFPLYGFMSKRQKTGQMYLLEVNMGTYREVLKIVY